MTRNKIEIVSESLLDVAIQATPILGPVYKAIQLAAKNAETATESGEIEKLDLEAQRQKVSLKIAEMQAKVTQELAIAQRIANAEEVEIEEYYENSGKGNAGVKIEDSSAALGLCGEGQKVTKRIYRFSGIRRD